MVGSLDGIRAGPETAEVRAGPFHRGPQPVLEGHARAPTQDFPRAGVVGDQPLHLAVFRPEALDAGTIVIGGVTQQSVEQAMALSVSMFENGEPTSLPQDYSDANVSVKVVKIIESYTDIVMRTTWGR